MLDQIKPGGTVNVHLLISIIALAFACFTLGLNIGLIMGRRTK